MSHQWPLAATGPLLLKLLKHCGCEDLSPEFRGELLHPGTSLTPLSGIRDGFFDAESEGEYHRSVLPPRGLPFASFSVFSRSPTAGERAPVMPTQGLAARTRSRHH